MRRILVVAVLALLPSPAGAQIETPRETAPVEIGPVSLYPRLRIVDLGKDTNVFRDATDPQEDYTATVSSRLLAVVKFGANELLLSTGADYVWFKEFTTERSNDGHYAARANLAASRFRPYVGAHYTATTSRPNPEIDARARRTERAVLGGVDIALTERTTLTGSGQIESSVYDPDEFFRGIELAEPLNRTRKTVSGGMRYAVTPLTTFSVVGNYGQDTFPESHLRDSRSFSLQPVLDFSPDAMIRGQFMAGFELFRPKDPTLADRTGLVTAATLNWTIFGRTNFALQGRRNIGYSYLDSEEFYLWTAAHLDVSQRLIGTVDLLGNVHWDQLAYLASSSAPMFDGKRKDVLKQWAGGAGVTIRGIRVTMMVERSTRRSNQDLRQNYKGTRLVGSVTIGS
jgi:hypothetical protein